MWRFTAYLPNASLPLLFLSREKFAVASKSCILDKTRSRWTRALQPGQTLIKYQLGLLPYLISCHIHTLLRENLRPRSLVWITVPLGLRSVTVAMSSGLASSGREQKKKKITWDINTGKLALVYILNCWGKDENESWTENLFLKPFLKNSFRRF